MKPSHISDDKWALLCRLIRDNLVQSDHGLTTVGLQTRLAMYEDKQQRAAKYSYGKSLNALGFDVTAAVVLDALEGMVSRGVVARDDGPDVTLWRAKRTGT